MDDDDGDDDDDCGYLRDRTGERERERPSCLALSSSKREFALGRPRRTQTTPFSVGGFFFQFSAGARGYYEEGT